MVHRRINEIASAHRRIYRPTIPYPLIVHLTIAHCRTVVPSLGLPFSLIIRSLDLSISDLYR